MISSNYNAYSFDGYAMIFIRTINSSYPFQFVFITVLVFSPALTRIAKGLLKALLIAWS